MLTDRYGLPLSTASSAARDAYVEGCEAKLTMYPGAIEGVKRHAIGTPDRHGKGTPHWPSDRLVPVANRRVPRASRSALTSDGAARVGGACLPTGASRGGTQARFLKRQLSFPVSMISQWWVSRSRSAVVILASPNTLGHSPKVRLVVTIIEVRSYSRLIR